MFKFFVKKFKRLLVSLRHKKERWRFMVYALKALRFYKETGIFGPIFSQYGQDLFVKVYFYNKSPKKEYFFVDIGANDGIMFSNTCALECEGPQKWKGVLIEADKNVFEQCVKNRANTDKYNVALCNIDGEVEFMAIQGSAQMLSGIISEYSKEHLENTYKAIERTGGSYEIVKMQGARFDTIMKNYPDIKEIDYLSIDVEGGELKILQSIDFDKYKIILVGIEDNYPEASGIHEFMSAQGYKKICRLGCDSFYERKN